MLLIILPTILYGNHLNIQLFLIAFCLSSFIFTNNHSFNLIFFAIHIASYVIISFIPYKPIYDLDADLIPIARLTPLVLFSICFLYKSFLVYRIYIRNSKSENKKQLIYQTLFDNSYDGIITTSYNKLTKQFIESKNKKVLSYFDTLEDELSIAKLSRFFPDKQPNGESSTSYFNKINQFLKEDGPTSFKFVFKKKNGELFNAIITTITIQEVFEKIIIYLFRDVTQEVTNKRIIQYQLEELNEKNTELQKYIDNQLQFENFAHLAAHDLKTPIRTLVSFSQILQDSITNKISDEENKYLLFINKAAKRISKLTTDLSNFAELNAEAGNYELINFDLFKYELEKSLNSKFKRESYKLSFSKLPASLIANRKYLFILFYELISNAIYYKKQGWHCIVNINCSEKSDFFRFSITDNGMGIKLEDQASIFTIFKKANQNENFESTGIGLAICNKIVELHKGKLWVNSKLNEGSTFSFTISKRLNQLSKVSKKLSPGLFEKRLIK